MKGGFQMVIIYQNNEEIEFDLDTLEVKIKGGK
jgi:hypothetical protein